MTDDLERHRYETMRGTLIGARPALARMHELLHFALNRDTFQVQDIITMLNHKNTTNPYEAIRALDKVGLVQCVDTRQQKGTPRVYAATPDATLYAAYENDTSTQQTAATLGMSSEAVSRRSLQSFAGAWGLANAVEFNAASLGSAVELHSETVRYLALRAFNATFPVFVGKSAPFLQ